MKTVLAPGVNWPHPPPRRTLGQGWKPLMSCEDVLRLRKLRKAGFRLSELEIIFNRSKQTLITASAGRGIYEGF
jgi:hypothetical protein